MYSFVPFASKCALSTYVHKTVSKQSCKKSCFVRNFGLILTLPSQLQTKTKSLCVRLFCARELPLFAVISCEHCKKSNYICNPSRHQITTAPFNVVVPSSADLLKTQGHFFLTSIPHQKMQ
jgi:hypothetical protein